ncbi:uncharacterized protein DS421_16g536840 [Arachis hypogaea]|nr:uncharacterized protein DS421_16g536840 [Arachis hypogaea]
MLLVSRSSHSAVACLLSNPLSAPCSFSDARPGPSLVSSLHRASSLLLCFSSSLLRNGIRTLHGFQYSPHLRNF